MAPALTHADYSRGRLLKLLDEIDRTPRKAGTETVTIPAGHPQPTPPLLSPLLNGWPDRDQILDHAGRSATGAVIYLFNDTACIVAPPYPVRAYASVPALETEPLRGLVSAAPALAAVLLRHGGYAIGIYERDVLVESRNDSRFVKNRHRKGGQSQRRFDRIREKQVHELFHHLCLDAQEWLSPHRGRLDFLVYGGDTRTVQSFLKECRFLREFPCPVLPRFLTVPEPRHETLERLPALLSMSRVTIIGSQPASNR
jgi:hypothetical protein